MNLQELETKLLKLEMDIAVKLTEINNRLTTTENKVEDMKEIQGQIQQLVLSVNDLTTATRNLTESNVEIKADIKTIQSKDGNSYNAIKSNIVTTIIGLVLGALFTKIIF